MHKQETYYAYLFYLTQTFLLKPKLLLLNGGVRFNISVPNLSTQKSESVVKTCPLKIVVDAYIFVGYIVLPLTTWTFRVILTCQLQENTTTPAMSAYVGLEESPPLLLERFY